MNIKLSNKGLLQVKCTTSFSPVILYLLDLTYLMKSWGWKSIWLSEISTSLDSKVIHLDLLFHFNTSDLITIIMPFTVSQIFPSSRIKPVTGWKDSSA